MRFAASPEPGIRARYLASTSLHSMPRGPEPLGASTVFVYLAPDRVTIVYFVSASGMVCRLGAKGLNECLDEIQRLVPGYHVSRRNLLSGTDQHTRIGGPGILHNPELIVPANDDLFTSGTLGRYSRALNSVLENQRRKPVETEVAAD